MCWINYVVVNEKIIAFNNIKSVWYELQQLEKLGWSRTPFFYNDGDTIFIPIVRDSENIERN